MPMPTPAKMLKFFIDQRLKFRIIDLRFKQGKNLKEIVEILKGEGWDTDISTLGIMCNFMKDLLKQDIGRKETVGYILESFDRIKNDMQEDYDRTTKILIKIEKLMDSLDTAPEDEQIGKLKTLYTEFITALRERREYHYMGLKRLGELTKEISNIKEVNITVQQEINVIKHIKEMWFTDMEPELRGEELIFHKPKPELVNDLMVWQRKKKKEELLA